MVPSVVRSRAQSSSVKMAVENIESDNLVTLVAPSERWTPVRQRDGEQKLSEKEAVRIARPCGPLVRRSMVAF